MILLLPETVTASVRPRYSSPARPEFRRVPAWSLSGQRLSTSTSCTHCVFAYFTAPILTRPSMQCVFDIPGSDSNPPITLYARVDGKTRKVEAGFGLPPDGKYNVYTTMTRDDFFYVYSGRASVAAVGSMCITGRISVKYWKYRELQTFATSFDFSTPSWIAFYKQYPNRQADIDVLMRQQWEKAKADQAKSGKAFVVTSAGEIVPREQLRPDEAEAAEKAGRILLGLEKPEPEPEPAPAAEAEQETEKAEPKREEQELERAEAAPEAAVAAASEEVDSAVAVVAAADEATTLTESTTEPTELQAAAEESSDAALAGEELLPSPTSADGVESVVDAVEAVVGEVVEAIVSSVAGEREEQAKELVPATAKSAAADAVVQKQGEDEEEEAPLTPRVLLPEVRLGSEAEPEASSSSSSSSSSPSSIAADGAVALAVAAAADEATHADEDAVLLVPSPPSSPLSSPSSSPLSSSSSSVDADVDMLLLLPDLLQRAPAKASEIMFGAANGAAVHHQPPCVQLPRTTLSSFVSHSFVSTPSALEATLRHIENAEVVARDAHAHALALREKYEQARGNGGEGNGILGSMLGAWRTASQSVAGVFGSDSGSAAAVAKAQADEAWRRFSDANNHVNESLAPLVSTVATVQSCAAQGRMLGDLAFAHEIGASNSFADTLAVSQAASAATVWARRLAVDLSASNASNSEATSPLNLFLGVLQSNDRLMLHSRVNKGRDVVAHAHRALLSAEADVSLVHRWSALVEPHLQAAVARAAVVANSSIAGSSDQRSLQAALRAQQGTVFPATLIRRLERLLEGKGPQEGPRDSAPGRVLAAASSDGKESPQSKSSGGFFGFFKGGDKSSILPSLTVSVLESAQSEGEGFPFGHTHETRDSTSAAHAQQKEAASASAKSASEAAQEFTYEDAVLREAVNTARKLAALEGSLPAAPTAVAAPQQQPAEQTEESSYATDQQVYDHIAQVRRSFSSLYGGAQRRASPLSVLSPVVELASAAAAAVRSIEKQQDAVLAITSAFFQLPMLLPPIWRQAFDDHDATPPLPLSARALRVLQRWAGKGQSAATAAALVVDPCQAETMMWCLGKPMLPFSNRQSVTLGAVETVSANGHANASAEPSIHLLPVWRPKRLLGRTRIEHSRTDGAAASSGHMTGAGPSFSTDSSNAASLGSVFQYVERAEPPTVYNGLGSGLFHATARERLRMQFEDTLSAGAKAMEQHAQLRAESPGRPKKKPFTLRIGPPQAQLSITLNNAPGVSPEDEASIVYGMSADDTLQAAGMPVTRMVTIVPPAALQSFVDRVRNKRMLKIYGRTASGGQQQGQGQGQGGEAPQDSAPQPSLRDALQRFRRRVVGGAGPLPGGESGSAVNVPGFGAAAAESSEPREPRRQ